MQSKARHILVVRKANSDRAARLEAEIGAWLRARGHSVTAISGGFDDPAYALPDLDFAVVLGGDGTMLGVARRVAGRGIPLLGINFGRVGFLADIQPEQWEKGLADSLAGITPERTCMALQWKVVRNGSTLAKGVAVNDVVLSRAALSRLVNMDIGVDGQEMCHLRSDGVILSTPIGSSGYSVSAGGPLLYPSLNCMVFTPICPFLNTIPPMVFPQATRFGIDLLPGTTETYITVDGQEGLLLQVGDRVEVTGLEDAVCFVGNEMPFFERLRTRGFVTDMASGAKHK